MNPSWLLVIAALVAVIGIVIVFKQLTNYLGNLLDKGEVVDHATFQTAMTRFFIKVAVIEAIPIILIVIGMTQLSDSSFDIMVPLAIIILTAVFGVINVVLTKSGLLLRRELDNQTKGYVNTITFIGLAFVSTIPILTIVALIAM